MKKTFNVNPRAAVVVNEDVARLIEARIAARGEGAAGQQPALVALGKPSPEAIVLPIAAVPPAPADAQAPIPEVHSPAARQAESQSPPAIATATPASNETAPHTEVEGVRAEESAVGDVDAPLSSDKSHEAQQTAAPPKVRATTAQRKRTAITTRSYAMVEKNRHGTHEEPYVRKDGIKTRATTMHLPVDLLRELAVHCAQTGSRQSEIIAAALENYLK